MQDPEPLEYEGALHIIEDLNPSAYVLAKAERKIQDPDVEVDDVIEILKNDPAITADILHVANSAFYGVSTESKDLRTAVSQIGFRELLKLISLCVTKNILSKPLKYYGMADADCLGESMSVAILIDVLSKHLDYEGQEAYTIGLLSTVGKTVINKALEVNEFDDVYGGEEPLAEWENRVIGFDHARAGAMLLKGWEFPTTIIFMILHQFNPDEVEGDATMAHALYLSRMAVDHFGWGFEVDEIESDDKFKDTLEKLQLPEDKFISSISEASERFKLIAGELGIKRK